MNMYSGSQSEMEKLRLHRNYNRSLDYRIMEMRAHYHMTKITLFNENLQSFFGLLDSTKDVTLLTDE